MSNLSSAWRGALHWALFLWPQLILLSSPASLWAGAEQRTLTEEEKIIHVLNRLGFGPRPGDIERLKAMGIETYIERQLHPLNISDPVVEERLVQFKTLTMTTRELAEMYPARKRPQQRRSSKARSENEMETQREASSDRDASKRMQEARRQARMRLRQIQFELAQAKLIRAVYSDRQLQEVMVDFWMNHFNVFIAKGLNRVFTTDFEHNVIRPRALGKFEDLLMATARSPAMLFYLDNWISSAPAEVMEERIAELRKRLGPRFRDMRRRRPAGARAREGRSLSDGESDLPLNEDQGRVREMMWVLRRAKGLNENYGRELMELHSLGVDGGYTQQDVIQVARCLTGWTISRPRRGGSFRFEPLLHEEGDKVVLGQTIKSGGVEEGEQIIKILAHHPSTARFISTKLVRRFVADTPPENLVDAAARTFQRTSGDIREVLRTLFTHPQFLSREVYQAKVKKPFELVVSSLRAVSANMRPTPHLLRALSEMGERLYLCPEPTGYPDVASAWINTNSLLKRLNFALALAANRIPRVEVDLEAAQPLLQRIGLPEPDAQQTRLLLSRIKQKEGKGADLKQTPVRTLITSAFMLGSPQFQKR